MKTMIPMTPISPTPAKTTTKMKTCHRLLLAASLAGLLAATTAYTADDPDHKPLPDAPEKKAPAEIKPADASPDQRETKPPADSTSNTLSEDDISLRLNFRGVPLEMVLDYLSK